MTSRILIMVLLLLGFADRSTSDIQWIENRSPKVLYVRISAVYVGSTMQNGSNPIIVNKEMMKQLEPTFNERMVVLGHDWRDPMKAVGFVLKTKMKHSAEFNEDYLEMVLKITEDFAIDRITRGSFRFVSIGLTIERGRLLGQEVSFVNVPASRWSRVLEHSSKPLSID